MAPSSNVVSEYLRTKVLKEFNSKILKIQKLNVDSNENKIENKTGEATCEGALRALAGSPA